MIIWPATRGDIEQLGREMRLSDRYETEYAAHATGRLSPDWSAVADLRDTFRKSVVWAIWRDDDLIGLGGVAPLPQDPATGAIWFLGTHLADEHQLPLTLTIRRFIRMEARKYSRIGNMVPQHMVRRRRWLEKLGFDFDAQEAQPNSKGLVTFWSQANIGPDDPPRGSR